MVNEPFGDELDSLAVPDETLSNLRAQTALSKAGHTVPVKLKHGWRSPEAISHARGFMKLTKKDTVIKKERAQHSQTKGKLHMAIAANPNAAKAVGQKIKKITTGNAHEMTEEESTAMVAIGFAKHMVGHIGVRIQYLHKMMADVVLDGDWDGIVKLVTELAALKLAHQDVIVIAGLTHQFDSTIQSVSGHDLGPFGKLSISITCEVMVQSGRFGIAIFLPENDDVPIILADQWITRRTERGTGNGRVKNIQKSS